MICCRNVIRTWIEVIAILVKSLCNLISETSDSHSITKAMRAEGKWKDTGKWSGIFYRPRPTDIL